ncbi:hypothetical protein [Limosilactobacillus equigenerosi]|uniref:Uncharacterized protein n=1 Tax=Limosilactobacillus equigenerosi DSM 18793 = JCM 14505 TaxID=1423742 RepID=A0A0R1UNH0_9LACO|nr:hypothetical protein [Limosilactobacillus equigenerosi]KRL92517.1 hypothetical protein FC21_GL000237 [Limosilactobacillus equigenerosi DSM 18793 = JCM 14505]
MKEAVDFTKEHKNANIGRAVTYSGAVVGTTFAAGEAIGATAAALGAAFTAPAWLAAGGVILATAAAGMAISAGAKQAYKHNFLGFRDGVNEIGDNFGNPKYYNSTTYPVGPKY